MEDKKVKFFISSDLESEILQKTILLTRVESNCKIKNSRYGKTIHNKKLSLQYKRRYYSYQQEITPWTDNIMEEECEIPERLQTFIDNLIIGLIRRMKGCVKKKKKCIVQDIIFKTAWDIIKQLTLGM